jgi:hypothetical protein
MSVSRPRFTVFTMMVVVATVAGGVLWLDATQPRAPHNCRCSRRTLRRPASRPARGLALPSLNLRTISFRSRSFFQHRLAADQARPFVVAPPTPLVASLSGAS